MEQSKHLRLSKVALMFIGIWPFEFYHESRLLRASYAIYCKSILTYYFATCCCQWLQIFFFEDSNVDEILENFGVSLLYTINMAKVGICCSKGASNLIFQIVETEKRILSGKYISMC